MTKWYALNQQGDIVYLGEFDSFEAADASTEFDSVWVVNESTVRDWLISLLVFNKDHQWGIV